MASCVFCGHLLEDFANFCSSCGRPLRPAAAAQPAGDGSSSYAPPAPLRESDVPGGDPTLFASPLPTLAIQFGLHTRNVVLSADRATLGRDPQSDIVVPAVYVSAKHARIERDGGRHRIVDVGSRNGLFFNGQQVRERLLADGDVLRIPDPRTSNFVTLTYLNSEAVRTVAPDAPVRTFELGRGPGETTIGRAGASIELDNPIVSRRHARIEWRGDHHAVIEIGSTNGTYVNGYRVQRACPLAAGDVLQIGPYRFRYDGASLTEFDQRGAMRIDARGLSRSVPDPDGTGTRVILDDVWLSIEPREFVAVVGGSGAGKSTLLAALSGASRPDAGDVRINGDDLHGNFDAYRSLVGFVPQEDILHRSLPVDRALAYVARLRLPADSTDTEIQRRVARVLDAVGMKPHRRKLIEQLSGGQRKRVSIACELLADPPLLFLDEPTSGLDPSLEKRMMFTLRQLADEGRTIVLVTHATANLAQCDHVVFMAEGRVVFFGPPREALAFFHVTTGDLADVYARLEGEADPESPAAKTEHKDEYVLWHAAHPNEARNPSLAELWQVRWRRSAQYQRFVKDRMDRAAPGPEMSHGAGLTRPRAPLRASGARQFPILVVRYLELIVRDRRNLLILLSQAPIIAALLCLVTQHDVLTGGQAPYDAKKLLFMLSTTGVWFGIINAAREICKETSILRRERTANLSLGAYVASKSVVLGALVCVQTALLLIVLNLKVKFGEQGLLFDFALDVFGTLALAGFAGLGIGLLISAIASTPDKAISAVPLVLIPQILFAGLLFQLTGATSVLSWFTASRWAMDGLGSVVDLNEFHFSGGIAVPREDAYEHSVGNLIKCWSLLAGYVAVCIVVVRWRLRRVVG